MSDEIAIKVDHVSKSFKLPHEKHSSLKGAIVNIGRTKRGYEKQHVLKDISFEIKKGEFFGIVGRNGSGKSTLLKLLAGIYTPDKGIITVDGILTPFIELGVGFNPELSGRENVFLNGALLGFSRKEMEAMYDEIVDFAELERFMDQKLKNYSSGMQVRLAFSIAIRAKGDILLLDEVLAVGDAAFQQKCYNYFEDLKRQKTTVVFVSHDMGAVKRFCSRAIFVKHGELLFDGNPLDVGDMYAEDNIEGKAVTQDKTVTAQLKTHKLLSKIESRTKDSLLLSFQYKSEDNRDMYIGISLLRDGYSLAEIITAPNNALSKEGKITYDLALSSLNPGTYNIGAGLFRTESRELLASAGTKLSFSVKGSDLRRGAALRLEDTWKY